MTMEEDHAVEILKYISNDSILYSSILCNQGLKDAIGDIDNITANVHKLIAEGIISSKIKISPQEGEDFELSLTDFGKMVLKRELSH